jgi:hypothetical protein
MTHHEQSDTTHEYTKLAAEPQHGGLQLEQNLGEPTGIPQEFDSLFSAATPRLATIRQPLESDNAPWLKDEQTVHVPLREGVASREEPPLNLGTKVLNGLRSVVRRTKEVQVTPRRTAVALGFTAAALAGVIVGHSAEATNGNGDVTVIKIQPSYGGTIEIPADATKPTQKITPSAIPSTVYVYETVTTTPDARKTTDQNTTVTSSRVTTSASTTPPQSPSASASSSASVTPSSTASPEASTSGSSSPDGATPETTATTVPAAN